MIWDGKDVYCGACLYWSAIGEAEFQGTGECLRYAPVPRVISFDEMEVGKKRLMTLWPITEFSDACGDFKEAPHPEDET